jgi:lipopolysaccharide export system protein LptC
MSPAARERMLDGLRRRNPEVIAAIARRSMTVSTLKKTLPVAAAVLLVALALAPSWRAGPDANRVTYHVANVASSDAASRMQGAKYHGTDQHGQPFTLTANDADEQGSDNVALTSPEGDITLKDGAWLMLKSDSGMFHQKSQTLGLNGDVTLYRNDGTIMTVSQAHIDLHAGSANSTAPVQVQGPFGTLNAQNGFVLANRGTDITFNGPATMTLTQAQ